MTDFITTYFGYAVDTLTYESIAEFFRTARDENNHLEFKSFSQKSGQIPDKIYLTICGMLNSDGGLIIWGSPQEKPVEGKRYKQCIGELVPATIDLKKDDLIRSISDSISPMPNGIQVFTKDDNKGNYVYLIQVQKSEYSPHQTGDKYYMRLDGETRVAPHYFIEALFRKIKYPDLRGCLNFDKILFTDREANFVRINFSAVVKNNSSLQNEEFPQLIISCNTGKMLRFYEKWPKEAVEIVSTVKQVPDPMNILYYGKRIESRFSLGLYKGQLDSLRQKSKPLEIVIRFGGRFSPLKLCHYRIDVEFFTKEKYCEMQAYDIPTENIYSIENILVADSTLDADTIDNWESIDW